MSVLLHQIEILLMLHLSIHISKCSVHFSMKLGNFIFWMLSKYNEINISLICTNL